MSNMIELGTTFELYSKQPSKIGYLDMPFAYIT